ncbi:hypothetical protein CJ030_MR3G009447 [Morella rubra]|uniref:Uncharacterized protein n=1 Tax=Morella rubra TaxID=262757 RepID=A0A6A1W3W1_9ROSI|nr:hypothetical protein CJ030_MR3G009447 [Morella rubra]
MAMKKRADLCPSEADALSLSMAMWVIPSSRRFRGCLSHVEPYFWGSHEIPVPAVKVIREIGTPSFSISLTAPPGHGELPSSSRISNLPGTLTSERSEADEGDRPLAPGFQHAVLLSDSASSGGLDLPEAAGGVEVHSGTISSSGALPSITPLVMETPLEEPRTSGAVVIGDSTICPTSLNEEMMEDALRAPRHAKIDRLTRSLSHCVSLVAALDAAELKHDEELESSHLKLRKLEGDLESQRKLVEELRTVARGTHLQMQTYEARVMDLERDIASRDTEVAELRQTVDGLEQGRVDFELSLSREKAELLQRLSDSRASSSKREEALRTELVGLRRAMREAADSFAAEKRVWRRLVQVLLSVLRVIGQCLLFLAILRFWRADVSAWLWPC